MSRKTLLTEAQVRQFMKLASLRPINSVRLTEFGYDDSQNEGVIGALDSLVGARDEEDELEAELGATEDELGAEDELAGEEGDELGDLDADLGAEEGGGDMVSVDDFMSALETALEDVMGEPTTVDMDAGEEEEEVEADLELPGGEELELGAEEEEELPGGRDLYENEDDLVNEVARRVAARLVKEKKTNDLSTQLAERIFNRITAK
ncbi:hypothetical protein CMI37_01330 [Candidatus Pacearchaeota archaeon]|nr:hypothetical protein [Candidatus Pacearchaeota archaeon]|tara:strand:+ start:243 stop:863 length:621 start_codon:yes stop_codon:yes gene_type:complete